MKTKERAAAKIARASLIAAAYVLLAYVSSPFQIAFFQVRLSEALCIMPIFFPEAIAALTIGCLLANYMTGCVLWDIVLGSLATLLGALGAYFMRRLPRRALSLATLPTAFANAFIVPWVIITFYGVEAGYGMLFFFVLLGEAVGAVLIGSVLLARFLKEPYFASRLDFTSKS